VLHINKIGPQESTFLAFTLHGFATSHGFATRHGFAKRIKLLR